MSRSRRYTTQLSRTVAAFGAAVCLLSVAATNVSATPPTPASGTTWSPNQRVEYHWKDVAPPPAWMKAAINAAAQDSNESRGARAAIFSQSDSGTSSIGYTGDIPTTYAVAYTIGNLPTSFGMRFRPQGYPLDWGTLRWCQFYDLPPTGCYDAEMIALHELGHAQTLDHADDAVVTNWTDTIMHWAPKTKAKAGWNQHAFGICDVARLQIRYQPLDSTTAYSTCLDLDTQLALTTSATNVLYGRNATFTARLSVAADEIYASLASDPVSARKVVLQQRPVGGSTWTTLGAMSFLDYNGRYSRSVTITNDDDYRAIFATPLSEGLNGSTSLAVRVTSYDLDSCSAPGINVYIYTC